MKCQHCGQPIRNDDVSWVHRTTSTQFCTNHLYSSTPKEQRNTAEYLARETPLMGFVATPKVDVAVEVAELDVIIDALGEIPWT